MDVMTCEAHDMIVQELSRMKDDESQLYELDRQRQATAAQMQSDITEIKTEQKQMKKDLKDLGDKMDQNNSRLALVEIQMNTMQSDVAKINENINSISKNLNEKKWTPKEYVTIIVALLSLIGTITVALLK